MCEETLVVPKCNECGFDIIDFTCGCGLPEFDEKSYRKTYVNVCWNCRSSIDSNQCVKSSIPGMGYHCNICGKDLSEYKENFK